MGTEGDSFFVVFESAGDAVQCCAAAQRAFSAHDWPGGVAVRVRMGLYSGEPSRHEDGYIGLDVHLAARIAATAHGGQVVLSEATRLLVASRLPRDPSLRDLGVHRLKDIEEPEQLYQLVAAGLQERFPPLKSLSPPAPMVGISGGVRGFPALLTSFVGRARELDEVAELLNRHRLVTVTGPGGVGKTRLAGEVARRVAGRFADGVWLAELAGVADLDLVPAAVATSLGIQQGGAASVMEALAEVLAARQVLLMLDNCEHLIDAVAALCGTLLPAADDVRILATSREPARVAGQARYRLPPLSLPEPAQAAGADGPGALDRLDDQFNLLADTDRLAPSRHRSLAATIQWSYELLSDDEQRVFRRISVFPRPFTLEAAEAVAGAEAGPAVLQVAGQAAEGLATRDGELASARSLDAEDATMQQAQGWALEHDQEAGLRLVIVLAPWWLLRGHWATWMPSPGCRPRLFWLGRWHGAPGRSRICTAYPRRLRTVAARSHWPGTWATRPARRTRCTGWGPRPTTRATFRTPRHGCARHSELTRQPYPAGSAGTTRSSSGGPWVMSARPARPTDTVPRRLTRPGKQEPSTTRATACFRWHSWTSTLAGLAPPGRI
jgi:hypothetical protein